MLTIADLDLAFRALGDPTRREMLKLLAGAEQGVVQLASNFDLTQPAVTKHLNVLAKAGLISREKKGRYRMCRLEPEAVQHAADWLDDLGEYWRHRFAAIDEILREEKKAQ
jgi:DNA-binding transcriptional ArsR family regulator